MKKNILIAFLLILSVSFYSQDSFEKGYFIKNSGEKVECLIKNMDLLHNPKNFNYKLALNGREFTVPIKDAKVFEVYGMFKYKRSTVEIDRSSEIYERISVNRKPEFNTEQLFLKVLVEGKASLYYYAEPNLSRYFYKKDTSKIEQLVFKSFTSGFDKNVRKNERYKQQLLNNLQCEAISKGKVNSLRYQKSSLTKLFIDYNKCVGSNYINYTIKTSKLTKSHFNLSIRPGLNISSLVLESGTSSLRNLDYGTEFSPRIGLELELVLGFNNNKWALIMEPTYQSFVTETEDSIDRKKNVSYSSIEIPFGIRHYLFLNKSSKIFINGLAITDFPFDSQIDVVDGDDTFDIDSVLNYGIGAGYKYNDKFSIELRVISTRELLGNFLRFNAGYRSVSVILGYTLF